MKKILNYFPDKIKDELIENINDNGNCLEEIRIRNGKYIILKFNNEEKLVKYKVNTEEILMILQLICENSIYSYQEQIANGFITINGGHRVGITGSCVIENNKVKNINYISSLNFRISKQLLGVSNNIIREILDLDSNLVYNTLIVSKPGAGKTTLIRDLIRQVSNGIKELKFKGINVGVVDERGEISALYKGIPQNELGLKTDVIENVSKPIGIKMLVRSMAPQVIVADEIGGIDDCNSILYAMCSGCKGIFTAHGNEFEDLYLNSEIKELINSHVFEVIIFLDAKNKGKIKEIYKKNKNNLQYELINE